MDQHRYSEKPAVFTHRVLKISAIGLRILTTIFLFLSLIILITKVNANGPSDDDTVHFYDLVGYRYMTATIVLGGAYSIWQTMTAVIRLKKGYEGNFELEYYCDKVMSIALATGSVAGFVMTGELQREAYKVNNETEHYHHKFFKMGYAADGFLFLGFICALILSELSSYALPRRF
ncbi:CASP-like protein 4D1 [Argentina anserina]|uniref:CASP-like protein 4D1 n=1 Tax=Argentina anserina TaxID=57926 RepID=UPI002176269F|nr:CASP-like protein 4D1 [Potentilla anserina]